MESGTFAPPFFIIFLKNLTFQRRPKVLVWSKGLKTLFFGWAKELPNCEVSFEYPQYMLWFPTFLKD